MLNGISSISMARMMNMMASMPRTVMCGNHPVEILDKIPGEWTYYFTCHKCNIVFSVPEHSVRTNTFFGGFGTEYTHTHECPYCGREIQGFTHKPGTRITTQDPDD